MERKVIPLEIIDDIEESGVSKISLVDVPAIDKDWMAFRREEFVNPTKGERETEFIPRCITYNVNEGKNQDQAAAICYSMWQNHSSQFNIEPNPCWEGYEPYGLKDDGAPNCVPVKNKKAAFEMYPYPGEPMDYAKVSFDFDDTLSTGDGLRLAQKYKQDGDTLYIISARNTISKGMLSRAKELGISADRVFATGSNKAKVAKVLELAIDRHIDNNADVIKELGATGLKFSMATETYTDYPEDAVNNAKRALEWADKNGWGDCGMGPGKARANQLANKEAISEDTIARMASFARHRQNSDTPYSEGCGKLMWDAWGGEAGISWASRKLKEIRGEKFDYDTSALPAYVDQTGTKKTKKVKMTSAMDTMYQGSSVSLDIPLFLRLLEIARENLNDDDQLHSLVEKAAELSSEGKILTMDDLEVITANLPMEMQEIPAPAFPSTESTAPADSGIEKLGYPSMVSLPRGHTIIIMAEGDTPPHGLLVQLMETGGYDVKYWYNNTRNVVPSQVNIDGAQVADEAMSVHLGYHGSLPFGQGFKKQVFASEDQQIVVGPAMIPDMEIIRKYDEGPDKGKPYWVSFTKEVIKKIAEKFMRELRNHDTNILHDPESDAKSYVMETWIVENEQDKANSMYNMEVPIGTWMVSMRVTDPKVWKAIKAGKLNGFSIEGNFMSQDDYESYKKDKQLYDRVMKILKSV